MAITRVEAFLLQHDLTEARGPSSASYTNRQSALVKLTDHDGLTGWGETYPRPGTLAALADLGEFLLGRDPSQARRLTSTLWEASQDAWAVGALAIAIDDLRARRLGVPVSDLYGGVGRDKVRAYASSGGYLEDVSFELLWPEESQQYVDDGFTAIKLRIGRHSPAREVPILERIREDLPPHVDLIADGNGAYTLPRAIEVGRALERLGLLWFEEPMIRTARGVVYPGYPVLTRTLDVAIGAGEALETRGAFDGFIRQRAADIVQPDVGICGGIAEALFVAEMAGLHAQACIPHAWGGAVLLAATLQLLAVLPEPTEVPGPDSPLLELDTFENPMLTQLALEPFTLDEGWISIPDEPGLGIEVDEAFVSQMSVAHAESTQP